MNYELENKQVNCRYFIPPASIRGITVNHSMEQQFSLNTRNSLQYLLIHSLNLAIGENLILKLDVAYMYLVCGADSTSPNLFKSIVEHSFEQLSDEYYLLVKGHQLEEEEIALNDVFDFQSVSEYMRASLN